MITNIFSRPEIFWFILGLVLFLLELSHSGFIHFFLWAWCLDHSPGLPDRKSGYQSANNNFCNYPL